MMKLTNEQVSRILWVSGCYIEDSMDYGVVPDNVKDNVQYLGIDKIQGEGSWQIIS